jgi:hypothetical protein
MDLAYAQTCKTFAERLGVPNVGCTIADKSIDTVMRKVGV